MVSETIDLRGHIIDSLILPKVLDKILLEGCDFKIIEIKIDRSALIKAMRASRFRGRVAKNWTRW